MISKARTPVNAMNRQIELFSREVLSKCNLVQNQLRLMTEDQDHTMESKKEVEKECLAVVWAIEKLKVYLCNKFIPYTNHSAL